MKGWQDTNTKFLYIFPQTADDIPYVPEDTVVIYVQQEDLAAWVAENETYASLMQAYNYNLLAVRKKVWADHIDDDLEPPVVDYNITYTGDASYVTGPSTGAAGATITLTPTTAAQFADITLTSSDATITKNTEDWTFTMPEADVAINVSVEFDITYVDFTSYVTGPSTGTAGATITITPTTAAQFDNITLISSGATITKNVDNWTFTMPEAAIAITVMVEFNITYTGDTSYISGWPDAHPGDLVQISPYDPSEFNDITLTSSDATITKNTEDWTFTMPANNITINVAYNSAIDYRSRYFTVRPEDNNINGEISQNWRDVLEARVLDADTDEVLLDWTSIHSFSTYTLNEHQIGQFRLLGGEIAPDNTQFFNSITGEFSVEGNIMSLCEGDDFLVDDTTISNTYQFGQLFRDCNNLISAEHLILPATTLTERCYSNMFYGCTSLTTAPELPATTLADRCYMYMFYECTSLNYIKCLATDISAISCTGSWVYDVASAGTFVKDASMNDWEIDSAHGIPFGWTVEDAPV